MVKLSFFHFRVIYVNLKNIKLHVKLRTQKMKKQNQNKPK